MPALTTPKNGIAEGQQQHFWLPNELIHELLLWVRPSYFWRVRQMLTTSAILCPLLMGGKHAITWHQPYDVEAKELTHSDRKFGEGQQLALLCRSHSQSLPGNFLRYQTHSNGTMTVFVILLLDETKFASPTHIARARNFLDCSCLLCEGHQTLGQGITSMTFVRCPGEDFDLAKIKCDANFDLRLIMSSLLEMLQLYAKHMTMFCRMSSVLITDQQQQEEGV
ncbi:hypothetical protein niasHT_035656 [Heterodera trifolii]|uniref:Uncharacterized protein n=1 Tax=Heterodera trifolii TaxID=157864 RepID=A0ABD2IZN4_9BILA